MALKKGDLGNGGHPIFKVRGLPGVAWRKNVIRLRKGGVRQRRLNGLN